MDFGDGCSEDCRRFVFVGPQQDAVAVIVIVYEDVIVATLPLLDGCGNLPV